MKQGRGKQKGKGFENKVAHIFTEWSGFKFRRVPLSGGWHKHIVTGDIFCVAEYEPEPKQPGIFMPFSLECKCAESWDFAHFFSDSEKSSLRQWWQQTSDDSKQSKKLPSLIFTKNYLPVFVMLRTHTFSKLAKLTHSSWKKFSHINFYISKSEQVTVLLLDDFLGWIDFQTLLKLTV